MISLPFSVTLLSILTILVYLGFGQRVLDRMRLKSSTALWILIAMILGHFLPAIPLGRYLALNLGALVPIGVVLYLLATTSRQEQNRATIISMITALLIVLSDKFLPLEPTFLDPVFIGGIFAGFVAYFGGRSRRSAFIAGILGVLIADLVAFAQLRAEQVPQVVTLGSGGIFSSLVISPFLAVFIVEVIGEVREYLHRTKLGEKGDNHED